LLSEHGILASTLVLASAIPAHSKAEVAVATHPVDAAAFVALNPSEKIALFRRLLLLFDIVDKQQIAWDVCDEFVVDYIPYWFMLHRQPMGNQQKSRHVSQHVRPQSYRIMSI